MSFREIDIKINSAAQLAWRWLRSFLLEDWSLKLIALAIALGLWYGVTGQRSLSTIRLRGVQLTFRLPREMEISSTPREEVEITLTGSKRALDRINVRDLVASVDLSNYKPGERVIRLSPDTVAMDLPEGVRLENIEPDRVPLRIEPRIEKDVEVEARLEGKLPEGYELVGVFVTPARVRVRGPETPVMNLDKAQTETISLDGRTESFTDSQIAIDLPDPKVVALDTIVTVRVEIREQYVEKRFAGVAVRSAAGGEPRPAKASVALYGPRSVIEQLRAEDVQIVLERDAEGAIQPRLELPPQAAGRGIALRWTAPAVFSLQPHARRARAKVER
jgi:YbbR domain-containing protein